MIPKSVLRKLANDGTNLDEIGFGGTPPVSPLTVNDTGALDGEIMEPFEVYPLKQTGFLP